MIVDLNMPVFDGVQPSREVNKIYPNLKVLGLTMDNDHQAFTECRKQALHVTFKNTGKSKLIILPVR